MPSLRPLTVMAVGALLIGVAGCHPPKPKGSATSAESHAPGTTMASTPAACTAYPAGSPGVLHSYCDGSAVVKLTIDGTDHLLKGGTCSAAGGQFTLNLGVVAGPGLAGPKPDYVGLTTQVAAGPFSDAVIKVNFGGKGYTLQHNTGQIIPNGGDFNGTGRHGRPKISATFTC